MQEAVENTSQRLTSEQRQQGRENIFARNRQYLEMTQKTNIQILGRFRITFAFEQTSNNLVDALIRRKYDRTQTLEYLGLLWHEEMVRVYEGLAALVSFRQQVVNGQTEEGFLASGVVTRLLSLTHTTDHPFVQEKSFQLLKQLASTITKANLEVYFNLYTIPITFFIQFVRLPKRAFNMMLHLLDTLNDCSNFINPTKNENMSLLDKIDDCVSACFTSNEGKVTEIAADLSRFSKLLNTIKVCLYPRCMRFTIRLYLIKRRIASYFRRERLSQEIQSQIGQVVDKRTVKQITNVIKLNIKSAYIIIDYVRDLINAGIETSLMSTYGFGSLLLNLISIKETKQLFSYNQLFVCVEDIIRADFGDQKWYNSLKGWISIIVDLLNQGEDEFFELFLSKQAILGFFGKIYETKQQSEVVKQLNDLVLAMIVQSSKEGVTETLCRHNLINKYFKSICHLKAVDIWNELGSFMHTLSDLKKQDIPQFETIRRIVVDEDIYAVIHEEKAYINFLNADKVFNFYEDLREQERLKQHKGNQIENQVVQALERNDSQEGFILRGTQTFCNKCLRHHTQ